MLSKENSVLLVVDVQEKFRPVIRNFEDIVENIKKAIDAFIVLGIPVIATEQYPQGLGKSIAELGLQEKDVTEKISFDCFGDQGFKDRLLRMGRKQVFICGIESHICVLQTVLSAIRDGYAVHVLADAISSRKKIDHKIALRRMGREGAVIETVESALFQMMPGSTDENFKAISRIVK